MLGNLPVPGRPTNLDYSRARACCACSRCGWGLFGHFFSHLSFLSSFSFSLGDGTIWTEILSQRAVKPKQPSNQLIQLFPKFSLDFLIKVNYSLRLLKYEYSASMCSC